MQVAFQGPRCQGNHSQLRAVTTVEETGLFTVVALRAVASGGGFPGACRARLDGASRLLLFQQRAEIAVGSIGDAFRRQVNSFRDDVRQAKGGPLADRRDQPPGGQQQGWLPVQDLSGQPDPYPWLLAIHAGNQSMHHKMVMGTDGQGAFIYTDERTAGL